MIFRSLPCIQGFSSKISVLYLLVCFLIIEAGESFDGFLTVGLAGVLKIALYLEPVPYLPACGLTVDVAPRCLVQSRYLRCFSDFMS